MEEKTSNGYLFKIYEENNTINSLIEFEHFVNLIVDNCASRNDIKKLRMYEFEELVVHNSYFKNSYNESYNEDVEYDNFIRSLSFNDNF